MLYRSHSKILGRRNTLSGVERLAYGVVLSVAVALSAANAWADDSAEEGLWQKSFSGWTTTADPSVGGTLVPGALIASCAGTSYTYNGVTYSMGDSQTWAYSGVMYMAGGVTYRFVKNYDDNGCIIITDPDTGVKTTVVISTSYNETKYGTYTPVNDGYYPIYLAVYNGIGGKGPAAAPFNNASQLAAGLAWTDDPSVTDCTTSNYQKWHKFLNNPGETPIFYTSTPILSRLKISLDTRSVVFDPVSQTLPVATVTDSDTGALLSEGVDYTLSYSNTTWRGTAWVYAIGENSYAGETNRVSFQLTSDVVLPRGYHQIEYICATGTQYIKTGMLPGTTTTVEMDFNTGPYQGETAFFGQGWAGNNFLFIKQNNAYKFYGSSASVGALNNNADCHLTINDSNQFILDYGDTAVTSTVNRTASGSAFNIFADYNGGHKGSWTLYSMQITKGGVLERDYVPARRESDGAAGLYDRAHDVFYANAGTGEFVTGDRVDYLLNIAPIEPAGCIVGGSACPEPVVTYLVTGAPLVKDVDYEVSYTNNTAPGIATVFVTGKAGSAYEGMTSQRKFTVYDAGPATPYPNLSRSYVPGGLAGFWDAIDNTATGVHDSTAAVWKDLSGHGFDGTMNGIATWVNGNAMHNEADGLPCTIPVGFSAILAGNMNLFECAFRPAELGVTRVVFSNYKAANYGMIIGHNSSEGTTYADGSIRYYSKSGNTGSDVKLASTVKTNELAFFTFHTEPNYMAAWRDGDKTAIYGTTCRGVQVTANEFIIGGRDDNAALAMRGDISFLRVYNRTLTKQERALNRALDLVRYSNRSLKYTLPSDMPDGYALDAERDVLRVRVNANAIGTKGLVSVGGGEPSKLASAWFDVGETVTMTYVGDGFLGWTNLPCLYTYPNHGDKRTVTFTAGAPVYADALSSAGNSGSTTLTAYSYVQKGLVSLFDGIDNAGTGEHQMDVASPWVDLTGSGRKWMLRNSGAWGGNSLTLANNNSSAYTTDMLFSYETAEFCAKVTSGNCLFVNADDYSRMFIFSPTYGIAAQRRSNDNGVTSGGSALVQYGRASTMTAVYREMGTVPPGIDYFINGAPIAYGRSQAKLYNTGAYPALGARYDGADSGTTTVGSLFAIRFYSRRLDPAEVAFNAALDQIRYFGADEAATLSNLTLPDGYRWNASDRCLEVRVDIAAKGGTVSLASGTWFRVGTPVDIIFTPAVGSDARWRSLPLKTTKSADGLTISFTAAAPAAIEVTGDKGLPALVYVSNGLIGLWDARENVAPSVHDGLATKWYDLTGTQQEPWTLVRGRSAFRDDALEAMGPVGANEPDRQASLLPQWYFIEASVVPLRTNSVVQLVNGRFAARHLYLNPMPGQEFVGGYVNSAAKVGLCPSPIALVRGTYAAAYNSGATASDRYYVNGVKLDTYGTYNASFDTNVDYPSLGNRYGAADRRFLGLFNTLRIYSRPLSETEAAFNAAVDRIRYDGALVSETLPATLPDGYRYDTTNNVLEVRVGFFAAEGDLMVNSGDATNLWVAVGEPVEVVYTPVAGRGVRDWTGLPGNAAKADAMTRISFAAAAPVDATVETAAVTSAIPASTYISEGLLASWDGLDDAGTTAGWLASGALDRRVNSVAFDGNTYMSNYVAGVTAALLDKSMTVEMFIRPRRFIWNGGYIHMGNGADVRELLLSMQGDRDNYLKAQGGAFGALQYAATSSMTMQYCGVRKNTDGYFGQDTSVAIVRNARGAMLALNDEGFCLTNTSYSARPTSDLVNVGSWLGKRNASFDLYALRIYKRVLTDGELAYNRALDRARFTGAELVLPEGYTNDAGVVKAKYKVAVTDGSGLVSVNGGEPAEAVEVWLEMGSTASVAYTPASGYAFGGWTGFPDSAAYSDTGTRATLTVNGPLNIAATGLEITSSDDNFYATAALPSATTLGNASSYSFTSGTVTLIAKRDLTIEQALVVGGGGAGGNYTGGGGGGGGVVYVGKKTFVPAGASITLQVGAGGAVSGSNGGMGGKGASSFLFAGDLDVEAFGGGGGGGWNSTAPSSGGSIGSSGGSANMNTTAHIDGWNYTSSQGHTGGISMNDGTYRYYGPGGGGAFWSGESTVSVSVKRGYNGGLGSPYYLGSEVVIYGSGGGGGGTIGGVGGTNAGAGGSGTTSTDNGTAGTDGFGGGGGGGGNQTSTRGGAGGAGAVVFVVAEGDTTARNLEVTLPERVFYFGSPVTPEPVVTLNGATLEKDVDYSVSYVSNAAPGFAGVLVAGIDGTAAEGLTATRSFVVYKGIFATSAGSGTQDGSSWANAMAPQAALTAAKTAFDAGAFPAVFFKSGTYQLSAALTLEVPGLVLGGYLGAGGVSLELDESNPETWFDGKGTKDTASTIDQAIKISCRLSGTTNVVERCAFYWCRLHGFMKEGASSIVLRKCRFNCNAADKNSYANGRGFYISGANDAVAVLEDCDVSGQIQWNCGNLNNTRIGFGGYISTFRRAYIDNTTFVTNGWVGNLNAAQGSALYVTAAPLTMRNSRIVANQLSHPYNGGTVCLVGNCGGSAFTNCAFVGNANRWSGGYGNGGHSGALHVRLTSPDDTVDIDHCPVAYNLQGSKERTETSNNQPVYEHGSAAGLDVDRGTVKVRNSIFWGNAISTENGTAADLYVHNGRADVDYTLFASVSPAYVNAYPGAGVVFGEHIILGDPRFVTGVDTVKTLSGKAGFGIPRFSTDCTTPEYAIGNIEGVAAIDVHVSSSATGYSRAIDGSIPSWPVGDEPAPNGGIANLGCYGTTAEAATSSLGAPGVVGGRIDVDFSSESAGPRIEFTLDGDTPYNATALVEVLGGGQSWTREYIGLQAGDEFAAICPVAFPLSTEIAVRVTISTPGQEPVVVTAHAATPGSYPPWYGHGGDSNKVIHVRVGSTAVNPRGTSWADAYPDIWAACSALTATRNEIWLAGDILLREQSPAFNTAYETVLRGGFTGIEDSADERDASVISVIDGDSRFQCMRINNHAKLTIERIDFRNGYPRAVIRGDAPGDLVVEDCSFYRNGVADATAVVGCALYFYRNYYGAANLTVRRCRFELNGRRFDSDAQLDGACIYLNTSQKSLTVEDSVFFANGAPFADAFATVRPVGSCIYSVSTPITVTGCRFAGNRACSYKATNQDKYGGVIYLSGTCSDNRIANCAFVANETVARTSASANLGELGGAVVVNLGQRGGTVDIESCTFAWNLASGKSIPSDVLAYKGTVRIRNSIFLGGLQYATAAGTGRYVHAADYGVVNVAYTMFDIDPSVAVAAAGSGLARIAGTCVTGDPCFVSGSDLGLRVRNQDDALMAYDGDQEIIAASGDVHLLSTAGYFNNDGVCCYDSLVFSPAIDAGDPYSDFSREGEPNGACINLGCYGNTDQASRTPASGPDVDGIPQVMILWDDPDGYSRPTVSFMMGGIGSYVARCIVYVSTDSGETWEDVSGVVGGLVNGKSREVVVPRYYIPGSTIMAKVELIGARQTSGPAVASVVVEGTLPPWYGRDLPNNVIYVNPDAKGKNDGTSWMDAFTLLVDALNELSDVKNEIWVAGTNVMTETMVAKTLSFPVVIRGGFAGVELFPDDRAEGTYSTFDGNGTYDLLKLSNADGCPLVVERLIFTRAGQYAFVNSGSGALSVINCQFISNLAPKGDVTGRGVNLSGSFTASFTNCVWRGNMKTAGGSSQAQGSAIYANGLSRLFLDDCLFITNGMSATGGIGFNTPGRDQCNGDCLWMSGTPITARNCHFRGNRGGTRSGTNGTISGTGGVILLAGASGNSAFTNCTFAGNWGGYAESKITTDAMGTSGGALDIRLSTAGAKVDFEQCTLAYNLFDTRYCPGGLNVERGTVTMHNSIIFGNVRGKNTTAGHDIHVMADGRLSLSHCWLTEEDGETAGKPSSNYVSEASAGLITYNNLMFGDPLLATSLEDFESNVLTSGDFTYMRNNTAGANFIANINVHLRGGAGYFDENTGARVMDYRGSELSPAVDAGDPKADYSKEPVTQDGWHGKRVNLGAYGNTPWATSTKFLGAVYYIR